MTRDSSRTAGWSAPGASPLPCTPPPPQRSRSGWHISTRYLPGTTYTAVADLIPIFVKKIRITTFKVIRINVLPSLKLIIYWTQCHESGHQQNVALQYTITRTTARVMYTSINFLLLKIIIFMLKTNKYSLIAVNESGSGSTKIRIIAVRIQVSGP